MGWADRTIKGIKYEDFPSTEVEARKRGFKWYFTGIPCKRNHILPRNVSRGECYGCAKIVSKRYEESEHGSAKIKKRYADKPIKPHQVLTPEQKLRVKETAKRFRERHREKLNERNRVENLSIEQILRRREMNKIYRERDKKRPEVMVIKNMRNRMRHLFETVGNKTTKKQASTYELVGCNKEFLKQYIEKQFVDGMSWEKRSAWAIDHIIPLNFFIKHFDIGDINIQKIAFHYSNLQPLFKLDNHKKNDYIYIRSDTLKKNGRVIVDMDNPVFSLFVHLIEVEVKNKLEILKKTNTVENVGQITVSVKKEFDKIIGA